MSRSGLAYRQRHLRVYIGLWLKKHRLVVLPELDTASETLPADQREVAQRTLAQVADSELPYAIAFLMALHHRPR